MNEAITNKLIACQEVLSTTLESSADDLMMTLTGVNTRVALSGFLKDFMSIFFVVKLIGLCLFLNVYSFNLHRSYSCYLYLTDEEMKAQKN